MTRKETRKELEDRCAAVTGQGWIDSLALSMAVTGELQHLVTTRHDGWTYHVKVGGLDRADGGIIVTRAQYPGQRDQVHADYVEQWLCWYRSTPWSATSEASLAFAKIAELLYLARDKATAVAA